MRYLVLLALTALSTQSYSHGVARPDDAPTDRVIHFPDRADYKTLTVDLHTHSVFSDGHVWPVIRIGEALKDGLDAIAITEHLEWQPHRSDIPHADRNRAFEEAKAAAVDQDLIVIAGSEITREKPAGHINAVFINDANSLLRAPDPPDGNNPVDFYMHAGEWPVQDAVQAANDQGAFVFWNHPYWTSQQPNGIAKIPAFHKKNARKDLLHGIEIANGDTYSEESFAIALKHGLTLIGVSDVHNLIDWDYAPHEGGHRPVTLVLAEEKSADSIREALFAGRTVVWFKNLLIGRDAHLSPLLDAAIHVTDATWTNDTDVLSVSVHNDSDAAFQLRNDSRFTFMNSGDLIELAANTSTSILIKPGKRTESLLLEFTVLNALTAPDRHSKLSLDIRPEQ